MIRLIDTLSHESKLRSLSPLWKCGFAAALFMVAYLAHDVVLLMIIFWLPVWIVRYGGAPLKSYVILLVAPCLFFAASLPALLIEAAPASRLAADSPKLILGSWFAWTVYISEPSLLRSWSLLLRIIACLSCFLFVVLTTPVSELFQVMKKLRMPGIVLELMQIMYRFLFLLTDTAEQLLAAQRVRGGQIGFKRKIIDTAVLITRLFGKSMQRYTGLSYGLQARGFEDELLMAPYEQRDSMPRRYRWEAVAGVMALLAVEIWLVWREIG